MSDCGLEIQFKYGKQVLLPLSRNVAIVKKCANENVFSFFIYAEAGDGTFKPQF